MKISPFIGSRQVFSLVILLLSSCTGIDGWQEEIVIPVHKIHSNNTQNPPSTTITELFSRQWAENYATDRSVHVAGGCSLGEANYTWRRFGFGTNINNLVNTWVYALAVKKWQEVAVIIDHLNLHQVTCTEESGGAASRGWECIFLPMPHLCVFSSSKDWNNFMVSVGVSKEERRAAGDLLMVDIRNYPEVIEGALEDLSVDHAGASAVMASYLWGYLTPWIKDAVEAIVDKPSAWKTKDFPFIALHVRRGDKLTSDEADKAEAEEYLEAASAYLRGGNHADDAAIEAIKGVWVASDDPSVVMELRGLVHRYFPNVDEENVVYISDGEKQGTGTTGVNTYTDDQGFISLTYVFADLQQAVAADVFVGTFSSNFGRLIFLLRESAGKRRDSSLSLDDPIWWPGRLRT